MRRSQWLLVLMLTGACSPKTELEVEFDEIKVPADYFRGLTGFAVTKSEGMSSLEMRYFLEQLRSCKALSNIHVTDNYVNANDKNPKKFADELEREIGNWKDVKPGEGVISLKVIKDEQRNSTGEVSLVTFKDQLDHDFYATYGYNYSNRFGFPGQEELAPKTKTETVGAALRKNRFDIKIQYLVYNRQKKKIAGTETISARAGVNVYSPEPVMRPDQIHEVLMQSVLERIVGKLCPKVSKKTKRQLMAAEKPKGPDLVVSEGIELADDDQWDKAAEKWRSLLGKDKTNPYASHDLGVYAERNGEIGEAAGHYQRAKQGKKNPRIPNGYYEDLLSQYVVDYKFKEAEPRIFALSSGNWAYVVGGQTKMLHVGTKYPVYRIRQLRNMGQPADGLEYTEVGVVEVHRVEKGSNPLAQVRIVEFIFPLQMDVGDTLLMKPL